jgi:hypothetical protein
MSNGFVPLELIVDAVADAGLVPIRHQNLPDGRTKLRVIRAAMAIAWIPLEEVRKRKSAESAHAAAELQDAETSGRSSTSSVSS